ncbi:DUF4097 family beta strand repeat-containing protein [Deinococcus peraridilitoris]|uniref:DUF4097 domain-containing protein n=1 Tax=Deinococcus peraridilitoris (strain DSM 19664 / LMG 22246 / CIP 109416 / KR-200) TaxID=937777 RepID=K9ZZZ0_DEIPD|nr:DUF4097 family beta strand repeat-containing protein [Deinococcus peraridilitoris]AFZ67146.1 hypothetical protein Deipe_1606 [Deinococcus peraridilitoris DSM 19664]
MNSQDDFRARVQALVAEGKLTAAEAETLLAAPSAGVQRTAEVPEQQAPRRLRIAMQGASVQVYADSGLTTPQVTAEGEGRIELLAGPDGWTLRRERESEGWLNRLTQGLFRESLKIELRIPEDFRDVSIDLAGGNVRLHDLNARVQGKVSGGNLHLGQVSALNVNVTGGNLQATATLEEGEHSVKLTGGNATLSVPNAASVRLNAQVVGGSLRTHGFAVKRRDTSPATATYEGYTQGNIRLNVSITGGNATLTGAGVSASSEEHDGKGEVSA